MLLTMALMFAPRLFLDFIEIVFVVVPIVGPAILMNDGISPVWFAIMIAVNIQTSFLTPPFRFRAVLPARGGTRVCQGRRISIAASRRSW